MKGTGCLWLIKRPRYLHMPDCMDPLDAAQDSSVNRHCGLARDQGMWRSVPFRAALPRQMG